MGIFSWLGRQKKRATITTFSDGLKGGDIALALGGGQSISGVNVNQTTAMQIAAVQACVRAISQDIAGLPFCVYRRTEDGKEKAPDPSRPTKKKSEHQQS